MTEYLPVTTILGWCAAAGILFGSIMAIAQRDFKRMLAYSTVAQVSYIGLGIGLANPLGLIGALLHILNHAFMKSCLFLVVGGIRHQTGLREIPWFSGLGRHMPLMMAAFSMAALSMVGIPPTAGFVSKWYLVQGTLEAGQGVFTVTLLLSGLLNAGYLFPIVTRAFFAPSKRFSKFDEASAWMMIPLVLTAVLSLLLGVFPEQTFQLFRLAASVASSVISGGGL
jgi:multicomponent Na+:H+ antiporter subunit D